jgi:hypothetical protein
MVPKSTKISGTVPRLGHEDDGLRKASNNSHRDNETSFTLETVMPISDHLLRFFGFSPLSFKPPIAFEIFRLAATMARVFVLSFGTAVLFTSAFGQGCDLPGVNPPTGNELPDGVFLPDRREGETQVYRIQRVVGTGRASDYDADGFIRADRYDTYHQNGIVADTAKVQVGARLILNAGFQGLASLAGIDAAQAEIRFFLNGHPVGKPYALIAHATNNDTIVETFRETIEVPSKYLKFARMLGDDGGPCPVSVREGETTCPGENRLYMQAKVSLAPWQPQYGTGLQPYVVDMVNFALNTYSLAGYQAAANKVSTMPLAQQMEIQASSPVILVHGCCGETAEFFHSTEYAQASLTFRDFLLDKGLGVDTSITLDRFVFHSANLFADEVLHRLPQILSRYNARTAHLIAHSKGGLSSRVLLKRLKECDSQTNIGILSLTTLDTPHRGSVAADLIAMQKEHGWHNVEGGFLQKAIAQQFGEDPTCEDLTQQAAGGLGDRLGAVPLEFVVDGKPRSIWVRALAADANLNGNWHSPREGKIDFAETVGFRTDFELTGEAFGDSTLAVFGCETLYNVIGGTDHLVTVRIDIPVLGQLPAVFKVPTKQFRLNDYSVTMESANFDWYPLFETPRAHPNPGYNHRTVSAPEVALEVVKVIRFAEQR